MRPQCEHFLPEAQPILGSSGCDLCRKLRNDQGRDPTQARPQLRERRIDKC
jgi:hypothetical protein